MFNNYSNLSKIRSDYNNYQNVIADNSNLKEQLKEITSKLDKLEQSQVIKEDNENDDLDDQSIKTFKYTVKSGDTLIKICSKNNIDYYENKDLIIKLNNINDPSKIKVGQIIKLPKE